MILDKRVESQVVSEEEHDFIIGTPMKWTIMALTFQNHISFPLFPDIFAFVQINCWGIKLKAIICSYNLRNVLSIDLSTSLL